MGRQARAFTLFAGDRFVLRSAALAVVAGLSMSGAARAAITAINTPVTSTASVIFDDTNSLAPPAGITNTGPTVSPWTGATVTLPSTTDPNTLDVATGNIDATFIPSSNTYALNLGGITLTQQSGNTGYATLDFTFDVEYQLDAAGLPLQPTLYPNFVVNGTVQSSAGSFAMVKGFINYLGVNTAGTISVLETVNYNSVWNTPGSFSGTAFGVPSVGTTPALVGNTTLTLSGFIQFIVDPATIHAETYQVPEPSTGLLAMVGLAGVGLLARRCRTMAPVR